MRAVAQLPGLPTAGALGRAPVLGETGAPHVLGAKGVNPLSRTHRGNPASSGGFQNSPPLSHRTGRARARIESRDRFAVESSFWGILGTASSTLRSLRVLPESCH